MTTDLRELLKEAREEIYARVPDKLTQVPDGEIFTPGPMGLSSIAGGTPKVGESAGYRTIMNVTGNWASGPGPWLVQHMLWADNPDYARAWNLINHIDAVLSEPAPEPVAMYDAIWSEFGGSEFDDMRRKVSADQLRRLFYMFARHWASGTVPLTVYESAVHGRQELRQALREARAVPPPASPSDARDAARLKWIVDWACRGGDRSELDEHGHIRVTTPEIVLQHIDAAIEREGGA